MHEMVSQGSKHYNFCHRFTRKTLFLTDLVRFPRDPFHHAVAVWSNKNKSNIKLF